MENGTQISVKVSTGAKTEKLEVIGQHQLRVRVQAPPEKGRANKRVAELIAEHYRVPVTKVVLVSGTTYREKQFVITG